MPLNQYNREIAIKTVIVVFSSQVSVSLSVTVCVCVSLSLSLYVSLSSLYLSLPSFFIPFSVSLSPSLSLSLSLFSLALSTTQHYSHITNEYSKQRVVDFDSLISLSGAMEVVIHPFSTPRNQNLLQKFRGFSRTATPLFLSSVSIQTPNHLWL